MFDDPPSSPFSHRDVPTQECPNRNAVYSPLTYLLLFTLAACKFISTTTLRRDTPDGENVCSNQRLNPGPYPTGLSPPDTQQCLPSCQRFLDVRRVTKRSPPRPAPSDASRILHSSRASSRLSPPLSPRPPQSSQTTYTHWRKARTERVTRPGRLVC